MRQDIQAAINIFSGKVRRSWPDEQFDDNLVCGYRAQKTLAFWTEADVERKWSLKLKDLASQGLTVTTLRDEHGQSLQGVLIDDGNKPLEVTFYCDVHSQYGPRLYSPSEALRPSQAKEMAERYRSDLRKQPVITNKLAAPTLEAVVEKVEAYKAAKVGEEEQAKMMLAGPAGGEVAGNEPVAALETKDEQQKEEEQQDDIVHVVEMPAPVLGPSFDGDLKGRRKQPTKGKGRSRGSGVKKANGGRKGHQISAASRTVASSVASSAGGSGSGPGVSNAGTAQSKVNPYDKYSTGLDITKYLAGDTSLSQTLHHAQRGLNTLEPASSEAILLKGHIELFRRSLNLVADRVGKMSQETRRELLSDLEQNGVRLPTPTRVLSLVCEVKEASPEKMLQMLSPQGNADAVFNPLSPQLMAIGLEEPDCAKVLQRALLAEYVVPKILSGEKHLSQLEKACQGVFGWADALPDESSLPLMRASIEERISVLQGLCAILSLSCQCDGKDAAKILDAKAGCAVIVRQVCPSADHWA